MKKILIALACAASCSSALALEVYGGVGTDGYTLGTAYSVSKSYGFRAEVNTIDYKTSGISGTSNYDAKLKINTAGAFFDYFPFEGGFRFSVGAVTGDRKVNLNYKGTTSINLAGTDYSVAGESLSGEAKYSSVSPYFGVGYGHNSKPGLGLYADLGVVFGSADVTLNASPGLVTAAGADKVEAERRRLQDEVNKLNVYPVLKLGINYTF